MSSCDSRPVLKHTVLRLYLESRSTCFALVDSAAVYSIMSHEYYRSLNIAQPILSAPPFIGVTPWGSGRTWSSKIWGIPCAIDRHLSRLNVYVTNPDESVNFAMILGRDWLDHYASNIGLPNSPFELLLVKPTPAPPPYPPRAVRSTTVLTPLGVSHYRHRAISETHLAHKFMLEGTAVARLGCAEGIDRHDRWRAGMKSRVDNSPRLDFPRCAREDSIDSYMTHITEASLDCHMPEMDLCRSCSHVALPTSHLCLACSRPERPFGADGAELEEYLTALVSWERTLQSTEIAQRKAQIEANTQAYIAQCAVEPRHEPSSDELDMEEHDADAPLRRPARSRRSNLALLSMMSLLTIMGPTVAESRPALDIPTWRVPPALHDAPIGSPYPQPALHALRATPSLGLTSLPAYRWTKVALLFTTGALGSGVEQRLRSTLGIAALLFIGEQFSDSCMHVMDSQPPPLIMRGIYGALRFGARARDLGLHVGGAWTTIPRRTRVGKYSTARPPRPSLSTLGESCGKLGFSSPGRVRGAGALEPAADGGTRQFAITDGWVERRLKIK